MDESTHSTVSNDFRSHHGENNGSDSTHDIDRNNMNDKIRGSDDESPNEDEVSGKQRRRRRTYPKSSASLSENDASVDKKSIDLKNKEGRPFSSISNHYDFT